jgi:hypothetical protein
LKLDTDGMEGVEWRECETCRVCLREFLLKSGVILIGSMRAENSPSSLVSDCTKGLVGGLKTKLEEYDEDKEGARDGDAPKPAEGNLGSN